MCNPREREKIDVTCVLTLAKIIAADEGGSNTNLAIWIENTVVLSFRIFSHVTADGQLKTQTLARHDAHVLLSG